VNMFLCKSGREERSEEHSIRRAKLVAADQKRHPKNKKTGPGNRARMWAGSLARFLPFNFECKKRKQSSGVAEKRPQKPGQFSAQKQFRHPPKSKHPRSSFLRRKKPFLEKQLSAKAAAHGGSQTF